MLSPSDWLGTLSLVFGGCCSNALTTEWLTSDNPRSGILITFLQFLVVSLYALPTQFTWSSRPRLKRRRVPLLPYLAQVALFFLLSLLNNAAFAYDIPMTVHIVFRSGGMIINLILGWLFANKRYTLKQVLSVFIVTIGIVLTTLSASKSKPTTTVAVSLYAQGIAILALALLLTGFLGLSQDYVFARYIKPTEPQSASDPLVQPSWQENMFYIHVLALPLFYFSRERIATEFAQSRAGPVVSLASVHALLPETLRGIVPTLALPTATWCLLANTATQLLCVIGVNRLTGRVTSLTVTLILTVRKAVSLLLSVVVYGGQANAMMWIGAALVFVGTIGYSTGSRRSESAPKGKKD